MVRTLRAAVALTIAILSGACSGADADPPEPPAAVGTATSPADSGTSAAPTSPTAQPTSGPAATSAEGWVLELRSPGSGATVAQPVRLCYAIGGTSRSAQAVLVATLLNPPAEGPDKGPRRFPVPLGHGALDIPVDKLSTGRHDLRIELIVDGQRQAGVTLTDLLITGDRSADDPSGCGRN